MKNSKLAVFFPGMGYTNDKPLLYYSRKMLDAQGFETKLLFFSGFPKKDKNNEKKMQKERDQLLDCKPEDIRALAAHIEAFLSEDALCVVGSAEKLKAESDRFERMEKLQ